MRLVLLAIAFVFVGCNDRRAPPEIRFGPPSVRQDMGADLPIPDMKPTSPSCIDRTDGVACALEGAAGVCLEERCVLVACQQGFGDCNALAADGCETRFNLVTSCGGCDQVCMGDETCQLGRAGYACSTGFSCPRDTFDVDGDLANGCEIVTEWGESVTLFSVTPEAVERVEDRLLIAGTSDTGRVLVEGVQNIDLVEAGSGDAALAVGTLNDAGVWVAWPDGISWVTDNADTFWQPMCSEGETRQIVDAAVVDTNLLVATDDEIFGLEVCAETLCDTGVFHRANYLAEFRDRPALPASIARYAFEADEFLMCEAACLFDDSGLTQAATCMEGSCARIDPACEGCEPSGANCPDFRPVRITASTVDDDRFYVLTARGLAAFRVGNGAPLFRLEEPFVAGMLSGAQYVDIAVEQMGTNAERVTLLAADGTYRTLELTGDTVVTGARPIHAAARLSVEPTELSGLEASGAFTVVADPSNAWAVAPVGAAIKSVALLADTIPGGVASSVVGTSSTPSDIEVYYSSPGQLQIRRVFAADAD